MSSDGHRAELRSASIRGARWISIARIIAETTTFAASIPLARLISPAEFGEAAVAMVVVALAAILGPVGLTAPVVQRKRLEPAHVRSATFLTLVTGLLLTGLTAVAAQSFGASLFGSEISRLMLLASPAWAIVGVGGVSQAILQRELRFRRIALLDSLSIGLGTGTALALAAAGVDAAAIVIGGLVTTIVGTAVAVVSSPPSWPRPTRRATAEIGGFALPVSLSSLAYSLFRNIDYAILGARMTAADVGQYWRAYQLGVSYQGKLSQVMLRVSLPVYARSEHMDDLRWLRTRIVRTHATVLVPLMATFAATAPLVIPWLYGPAWEPAVLPAQILTLAGIGDALTTGTGPLMVAIGRPGVLLTWNLCELAAYGLLIFVLAPYGLIPVCIGVAVFGIAGVAVNQLFLMRRYVGLSTRSLIAEITPGAVVGLGLFASLLPLQRFLEKTGLHEAVQFVLLGAAAFAIGIGMLRILFSSAWRDLLRILKAVSRKSPPVAQTDPADAPPTSP